MTRSTITPTKCPAWCTGQDSQHPSDEGWTFHFNRWPAVGNATVELVHLTSEEHPSVFVSTGETEGELSPDEARQLAALLLEVADLADGRQQPTVEVRADGYVQEVRIFAPSPLQFGAALSLAWNIEEGIRAALAAQIEAQA